MKNIELWHQRARPKVDEAAFNVQLGCHLEEIVEMLTTLVVQDASNYEFILSKSTYDLHTLASALKTGKVTIKLRNREEFLDSLADQVVTTIGVGHCANMKVVEAIWEVDRSNWSKFENGLPVFKEGGKIAKGEHYRPPNLKGMF